MNTKFTKFISLAIVVFSFALPHNLLNAKANPATKKLRILFLGGTGFVGPHTVQYALDRGHEVTLFNRRKTNNQLFPQLETIIGDRDPKIGNGLNGLKNRKWDAVIDTSGFVPRITKASSQLLADNVGQYLFVSTLCQYDKWWEEQAINNESRPQVKPKQPLTEEVSKFYCELKAASENAIEQAMPGRVTRIRPGYIVGPRDKKDRLTFWVDRLSKSKEILAPGKPSDITQFIDVRDLAKFMVHSLENQLFGAFNLVRPTSSFGEFINQFNQAINPSVKITWVPSDFLKSKDVQPWRDVSLWTENDSPDSGTVTWSSQKALDNGLTITPIATTCKDTLDWFRTLPVERQSKLKLGLSLEKQASVLKAWSDYLKSLSQ